MRIHPSLPGLLLARKTRPTDRETGPVIPDADPTESDQIRVNPTKSDPRDGFDKLTAGKLTGAYGAFGRQAKQ